MYPYVKTWPAKIKQISLRWRARGFRSHVGGSRRPMMVSLFRLLEATPPMADLNEPVTVALGALVRLSREIEPAHPGIYQQFGEFVDRLLRRGNQNFHVEPLQADEFFTFEEWLAQTSYTLPEKEVLRADNVGIEFIHSRMKAHVARMRCDKAKWKIDHDDEWFDVFGFPKKEHHKEMKVARGINARNRFRATYGPFIASLEKKLFANNRAFVKYKSAKDRPAYIRGLLERFGNKYFLGDYSSFEAMFTSEWMLLTSLKWIKYVSRNHPFHVAYVEVLEAVLAGWNRIRYKRFTAFVHAVRMSGEMDTSCANGLSNLLFLLFVYFLIELEEREETRMIRGMVVGANHYTKDQAVVVEGDDSATTGAGRLPTSDDFAKLGFAVTSDVVDDPGAGGFCGILQALDGTAIKDPCWVLSKFIWLDAAKYGRSKVHWKMALYRAKALSLAHELPQCPITRPIADAVIRITRPQHNRVMKAARSIFDTWEFERFKQNMVGGLAPYEPTTPGRLFMESTFGISVHEQLQVERQVRLAVNLNELNVDKIIGHHVPPLWRVVHCDLARCESTQSVDVFPTTNANNAAIEYLHALVDAKASSSIPLDSLLRSAGARSS